MKNLEPKMIKKQEVELDLITLKTTKLPYLLKQGDTNVHEITLKLNVEEGFEYERAKVHYSTGDYQDIESLTFIIKNSALITGIRSFEVEFVANEEIRRSGKVEYRVDSSLNSTVEAYDKYDELKKLYDVYVDAADNEEKREQLRVELVELKNNIESDLENFNLTVDDIASSEDDRKQNEIAREQARIELENLVADIQNKLDDGDFVGEKGEPGEVTLAQLGAVQSEFTEHKEDYAAFVKSTTNYIIKKLPNGVKDSVDESANTFVKRVSDENILDGSEDWEAYTPWDTTDLKCFYVSMPYLPTAAQVSVQDDKAVLTNGIPFFKRSGFETLNVEGLARTGDGGEFTIRINKSNLTTQDLIGFKSFLKVNPISFIYQLATPEIKPIDDLPINSKLVVEQQIKIKNLIDNQEALAYTPHIPHIEIDGDNTIYIKFVLLHVRNLEGDGNQVWFSTLGVKYPDKVKTSPSGVEGCIELLDGEILAYDPEANTMVILPWQGYRVRYICLVYSVFGRIMRGTFQEYYNDMRLKSLEQKIKEIPESPQQGDIIPSYWESHLTSKIGQISQLQNECGKDGTSFGFITDTHIGTTIPVSGLLVQNIMKLCDIPFFINGGDYASGGGNATKDSIIKEVKLNREMFGEYISRVLIAEGNHDTAYSANLSEEPIYYYAKNLTSEETYNYLFRHNAIYPQRVMGDDGKYFYQDDTFNKVRYIILNTSDMPYVVDAEGYSLKQYNKMRRSIMREEQVRWFSNVALDVPNDEWSVVVCSHIEPYSTDMPVIHGDMVARILQAFKDKTIYNGTSPANVDEEFKFSIDVDFTDKGGNVICWISGHMHHDSINRNRPADISFNIIETLNDNLDRYLDAPLKTKGTNTEQAFDILTINKMSRVVNITRIGAGSDRQFSY